MQIVVSSISIGVLYGVYDLFIKLSANRVSPAVGALVTQLFSVALIGGFIVYQRFITKSLELKIEPKGLVSSGIAGILIGTALILLFVLLQNKEIKAISAIPTILIVRTLSVIVLGAIFLKESVNPAQKVGFILSLIGICLINTKGV